MISKTAIIHPNVILGKNCIIEDFVIIGASSKGDGAGNLKTSIGDNAVIRSHTAIYSGNKFGKNFQSGNKSNIRELNEIGDNVSIGTLSVVEHHVKIGNEVRIHTQAFIPEYSILEDECWLGPNVVLTNSKYPKILYSRKQLKGVCIKKRAIIGANSTLLPGVVVGENALVGAGSVVTNDIPDNLVVAGNQAVIINKIENLPY